MAHRLESQTLSPRQHDVLVLLGEGVSPAAIAARLDLSLPTVRNHIAAALHKLDAHSALEAVVVARRQGLL